MQKRDNYTNRVELHCHTGFSTLDGTASVKDIVDFAKSQGMTSVAFTDHANVMAYPEIQKYCERIEGFKPIYGMEGYIVNDINLLGDNLEDILDTDIRTDVVVIDSETTGFSPLNNDIIELAAVKIRDGVITDTFHTLIKPSKSIPAKIHEVTGISDFLVKDADSIDVVLPKFIEFIGGTIIVGHNVRFTLSFIIQKAKDLNIAFEYRSIDTLDLSRFAWPELEKHTLFDVADECGINAVNLDGVLGDAQVTAEIYMKILDILDGRNLKTIRSVRDSIFNCQNVILKSPTYHITILAKNMDGIKALYQLISDSNLYYYRLKPRIRLSQLLENRENALQ